MLGFERVLVEALHAGAECVDLDDFRIFWRTEADPEARRELLQLIFERVWLDDVRIVAVRPKEACALNPV